MLQLQDFGVAFGERTILESVSFTVATSACTVLLGPSGTGKSTLLRTLAGYNDANPSLRTWGKVRFNEQPLDSDNRPALVMQNSKLLVSTVLENLVCNLPGRSKLTRMMQIERIAPVLEQAGCSHLLDKLTQKVVECSLCEQRIIAILRNVLSGTPLIMVDEPTAGLKNEQVTPILSLIEHLSQTHGLLVVLHNLIEARQIADRIILLASGQVQESCSAVDFFTHPESECGQSFLATGSCPEASRNTPSREDAEDNGDCSPAAADSHKPTTGIKPFVSQSAGPRGFLWVIPGKLAGTPWPGIVQDEHYDLSALRTVGITYLITLTEYPFDDALAAQYGIRCLHSPMPDMQPPTEEQAWDLCRKIDDLIEAGEVVAVHCRAGLGRTGTVLAAYKLWLAHGKLSALKALENIRRIEPLWVQSQTQVGFLEEFATAVANATADNDGSTPTNDRQTRQLSI